MDTLPHIRPGAILDDCYSMEILFEVKNFPLTKQGHSECHNLLRLQVFLHLQSELRRSGTGR